MTIYKGDAIKIPFTLKFGTTTITPSNCEDVEISIGTLIKSYADEEITYSNNKWFFQLTQEESFAMKSKSVKAQVRVKFDDTSVRGIALEDIEVVESISKEVL